MRRLVALSLTLLPIVSAPIGAQRAQRAQRVQRVQRVQLAPRLQDSTSARCLAAGWLAASAVCEGRAANAVSMSIVGATVGATAGFAGGLIAPTRCIGDGERAAVRGAIAGAGAGLVAGLLSKQISRRERAARDSASRAAALRSPARPWSWRDVRPAVVALGAIAAGGALVGASQGAREPSPCDGAARGAATGAAVYAGGGAAAVAGALLVVRFLF